MLEQKTATPEKLAEIVCELIRDSVAREKIQSALAQWHKPEAAAQIAETILAEMERERERRAKLEAGCGCCSCGHDHHARTEVRAKAA